MVDWNIIDRLFRAFPNSFINGMGEFIAHSYANQYFILKNCETELDVKCKVLEWFSRAAYKSTPYSTNKKNDEFHKFMLKGINSFLETSFTEQDMDLIYTYLGNCCNHTLTIDFINSGYDIDLLKERERGGERI